MGSVDFIIDGMRSFGVGIAIVTDGKEYTYGDLLGEYEKSRAFLERSGIPENSIVALRGEFSSGTTGDPKAAVHDLMPLLEKYKTRGKKIRSLAFLLFDHIGGFNTVMYGIANGGMLVTLRSRSPEEVASSIEKYRLELLPSSPSFLNMLLYSHIYEKYDLSSLKIISYGTEPMQESTLNEMHRIFPDVKMKQTYGLSEVGIMRTKSESSDSLWLKVGGDEDHQIKIVDGILYIKSRMSMLGYLNAPSPFDADGWMNTKDRVEQKGEYIRILGRESELINVGGEKVYPAEVESVLLEGTIPSC